MTNQTIENISGYKFISLSAPDELAAQLHNNLNTQEVKGTIFISLEGIKINLAGIKDAIRKFQKFLRTNQKFTDLQFHSSYSSVMPYKKLLIKIKDELITTRSEVKALPHKNSHLSAQKLKTWLDENRDIILLDVRNEYETRLGSFKHAIKLPIDCFTKFREAIEEETKLSKEKPLVMFCTGGIRCEKALPQLLEAGYSEVYQLDGGILTYLSQCGGAHYEGECFVFDNRISLDKHCQETQTKLCQNCQTFVQDIENFLAKSPQILCQACQNQLK